MYCSKCGSWALDTDTLCSRCGTALQVDNEPLTLTAAPAPLPMPAPDYAGFWRRVGTALVDWAVLFPFTGTVRILLGVGIFAPFEFDRASGTIALIELVSSWLYSALMESSGWQGTLGQRLLGVRVTDLTGRRISFARATGRHFAQLLSIFTFGIGFLMIAFHPRKQALHDLAAGCLIVRDAEASKPVPRPAAQPLPPFSGAGA